MTDELTHLRRPRFDNVISAGNVIQLVVITCGLFFGGVTFYNNQARQAEQLEEIQTSLNVFKTELRADINSLDSRLRAAETNVAVHENDINRIMERNK